MTPQPAKNTEELTLFVGRTRHFLNLWTIYNDLLSGKYVPSMGEEPDSIYDPKGTMVLILYAYFYSLVEDSHDGLNAFRVWREHFPEEERAIAAVEAQIAPFTGDLRVFRNRLGFHGSRSWAHEAKGFDLFANTSGTAMLNTMKNFKALASILLRKEMAIKKSDHAEAQKCRDLIEAIAVRATEQAGKASP
jgi:hypothetical protein